MHSPTTNMKSGYKFLHKIPSASGSFILTAAVFIFGISFDDHWIWPAFEFLSVDNKTFEKPFRSSEKFSLEDFHLENLPIYWIASIVMTSLYYYGLGGFIYWYYYVHKRDQAEEWKIQVKWASWETIRHSILLGTVNLIVMALFWGTLACYVLNGGPKSNVYFNISDYGWTWFILQYPIAFIYQDYMLYWDHRIFHIPFLYKLTHKVHHKYKQPTPFVGLAAHPVETLIALLISGSLCFLFPVHWVTLVILLSNYAVHALLDHSGVNFKAHWWQSWQMDTEFHDDHHKYTHVNFGSQMKYWDQIHGTCRNPDLDNERDKDSQNHTSQ